MRGGWRRGWWALAAAACALGPGSARAFDYLEHLYFTDLACQEAQQRLGGRLEAAPEDEALVARYLALALLCPARWDVPYCHEGYKLVEAGVNVLDEPPRVSGDYAITLGDLAALPDHVDRYGPIQSLPRAGDDGLVAELAAWLAPGARSAGGTIEEVAEDACETEGLTDWGRLRSDIDAYLGGAAPRRQPPEALSPLARAPVLWGPRDPAGVYSFNNPHYLDLVFRNHHHFGVRAYSTWLGFHGVALEIARRGCAQVQALDANALEGLAEGSALEGVDWDGLAPEARGELGCQALTRRVEARLEGWVREADAGLVAPVREAARRLLARPADLEALRWREATLDRTSAALLGLVFEAAALHFLQDGLAGGHMRTIRTRGGLLEVRHDHDRDNHEGVVAVYHTRQGTFPFVAHGDGHMMGPSLGPAPDCEALWRAPDAASPSQLSDCLIQHQRGVLVAVTAASLIDWGLGGRFYRALGAGDAAGAGEAAADGCALPDPSERFVCQHLPTRATLVAGEEGPAIRGEVLYPGSLPVPSPPFAYEALTTRLGFDLAGRAPQLHMSVTFLDELGMFAHWLRSMRLGLGATLGSRRDSEWFGDYTYSFHWRWAARIMIDMGVSTYLGVRDFAADGRRAEVFFGLAPVVGLSALPEGWVKIPLELSFSYRLPLTLLASRSSGLADEVIDGHFFHVGLGLAFMR